MDSSQRETWMDSSLRVTSTLEEEKGLIIREMQNKTLVDLPSHLLD